MFSEDRDLLVYEPSVFRDASWLGQTLSSGDASASGTILTALTANFIDAGVDAGHAVVLGGATYEVTARLSAITLRVSRVRVDAGDAEIPVQAVASAPYSVVTFGPQRSLVHMQLLRMLGLREQPGPNDLGASAVVNPLTLKRIEALGALHLVYSAASASTGGSGSGWWGRAVMYRERFGAERHRVRAEIDTDGDGVADAVRGLNVSRFVRG